MPLDFESSVIVLPPGQSQTVQIKDETFCFEFTCVDSFYLNGSPCVGHGGGVTRRIVQNKPMGGGTGSVMTVSNTGATTFKVIVEQWKQI